MTGTRLGALVLVLVLVLALAATGCGGDDDGDAEQWASDVCSNLGEWIAEVDGAVRSLIEEGLDVESAAMRETVGEVRAATDELVEGLDELGRPETEAGERAEAEIDELSNGLREQFERVERRIDEADAPLELATTTTAAVSAALAQLNATLADLRQLDPGGELGEAFTSSDDCTSLREQVADLRS